MSQPLISILIPTRERCSTLGAAIKTALAQEGPPIEIIVSDNASSDATEAVVHRFRDPRLKYVRTPRRLTVCDNFEFALNHARGEYILAIGDDDGIALNACARLARLIQELPSKAYYWDRHEYVWPMDGQPSKFQRPLPVRRPRIVDALTRARKAIAMGGEGWRRLPKVYHSAVARSVLDQLRSHSGRVFHSTQPDVCLAFAVPALVGTAVDVGECLTINGRSAASEGAAEMEFAVNGRNTLELERFVAEYAAYQPLMPLAPVTPVLLNWIADAILVAMALFPAAYAGVRFNHEAFIASWTALFPWWRVPRVAFKVIARRSETRRYHSFNTRTYLWWVFRFNLERLARRVAAPPRFTPARPADVWECARVLALTA